MSTDGACEMHTLHFVGGPKDGRYERWPARPRGEHVVVCPLPTKLPTYEELAALPRGFDLPPMHVKTVTYRERRRLHRPLGKGASELLYVEMEVAP